ncbi:MAG: hypothetical protein VX438_18295 [Planctomycetota bacterium]|jgi:hypothetical protein|nr:hypothetical protein [Planctomycetota bacterium]
MESRGFPVISMIFSALSKPKCVVCKRSFHNVDSVKSDDKEALENALYLGQFDCTRCKIKFHGMCGKIGQANPKTAIVTCPKCHEQIKHPLPFKVVVVKEKPTFESFGNRIDEEFTDPDL